MEFSLVQLKDHLKNTVEATCRGDPGAVFLSSTVRTSIFATQVGIINNFNPKLCVGDFQNNL
jgi:hypothetical protein